MATLKPPFTIKTDAPEYQTAEFFQDLIYGTLNPEKYLKNKTEIKKLQAAIKTIFEFENAMENANKLTLI